jgi:hypothetical protein
MEINLFVEFFQLSINQIDDEDQLLDEPAEPAGPAGSDSMQDQ